MSAIDGIKVQIPIDNFCLRLGEIHDFGIELKGSYSTSTGEIYQFPLIGKIPSPWSTDSIPAHLELKIHKQRSDTFLTIQGSFANFRHGKFPQHNYNFSLSNFNEVLNFLSGIHPNIENGIVVNYEFNSTGKVEFKPYEIFRNAISFNRKNFNELRDRRRSIGIWSTYGGTTVKCYSKTLQASWNNITHNTEIFRVENKIERLHLRNECRLLSEFGKLSTWERLQNELRQNVGKILFLEQNLKGYNLKEKKIIEVAQYTQRLNEMIYGDARRFRNWSKKYHEIAMNTEGSITRQIQELVEL